MYTFVLICKYKYFYIYILYFILYWWCSVCWVSHTACNCLARKVYGAIWWVSLEKLGCCMAGSAGGMGPGRSRMDLADIGCSFSILKYFTFSDNKYWNKQCLDFFQDSFMPKTHYISVPNNTVNALVQLGEQWLLFL